MTRHGKNCTNGSVYTYHEKKRDAKSSGYGSLNVRLGKDSVKDFDCCSLTLQPCRIPVITPDGHLFDKEAILEYILRKKVEITKKQKEFVKQKSLLEVTAKQETKDKQDAQLTQLKDSRMIGAIGSSPTEPASFSRKELTSFWIPSLTPQSAPTLLKKPDERVKCPMTGKPIRMKDLTEVHFTEIKDGDKKTSLIAKSARYVCAVTNDVLGNSVPCAVLKTSGRVVTGDCLEKIIRKDMIDPTNNKPLRDKDIVYLQRGASGFSAAGGENLNATKAGPAMMS